ncbi:YkgJ family cysteine cluster protein [Treponema pedis]|uniref:YkgJ family cysteine cluster protein n=1 Tax=Treponema pedis TaxID=409322 RepID=A0A7S7AX08_9SPIR|nr:YkgJ family cysteine cluster protein [Treponema pedis]QOW61880.1 YkgJ family cysteine cluster protein [Treponema pedis]QSI04767.1 YkgJ family cysteine cluster protein [Treponema pedis]
MDNTFRKNGLKFSCTQCSACCRLAPGFVFLSEKDLALLLNWSSMTRENFITVYCRWVCHSDGFEYLSLREKSNYDCILWKNGCTAYEFRPLQCSAFPFWHSLVNDKNTWNEGCNDCPGMGKGKLHSSEEIQRILDKQEQEPAIRRKIGST